MPPFRARAVLAVPLVLGSLAASRPPSAELDPSLEVARAAAHPARSFASERASFGVRFGGQAVPYRVLAVTALPGESVALSAPDAMTLRYRGGSAVTTADGWSWTAPTTPGIVPLVIEGPGGAVRLNVLVLHPLAEQIGESLNGYRIGRYLAKPLRGSPAYFPPAGFVAVGPGDADVLVSPHLTLGQFPCKQPGDPRYLHLTAGLVLKLEAILEAANAAGYEAPTFHVMSGFRTPAYNAAVGNEAVYSRPR